MYRISARLFMLARSLVFRTSSLFGDVSRSTMRYRGVPRDDDALRLDLIRLAKQYGRYDDHMRSFE